MQFVVSRIVQHFPLEEKHSWQFGLTNEVSATAERPGEKSTCVFLSLGNQIKMGLPFWVITPSPPVSGLTSVIYEMWQGSSLEQLRKHRISWDLSLILRWIQSCCCSLTEWVRLPPCPVGEGSLMLQSCMSGLGKTLHLHFYIYLKKNQCCL